MNFKIKIAENVFEINSLYDSVFDLCKKYICVTDSPDFTINTNETDIKEEYESQNSLSKVSDSFNRTKYSPEYIETLVIYRQIAEILLEKSIVLMHGSVIANGDEACMITAPSGTGKTARVVMWLRNIKDSYIVNGDKPLVFIDKEKAIAYGTPWCGKENMNTNIGVPLKAILFLERSDYTSIDEISFNEALPLLLSQTYKSKNTENFFKSIELLNYLKGNVHFYKFFSDFSEEAVILAYNSVYGK